MAAQPTKTKHTPVWKHADRRFNAKHKAYLLLVLSIVLIIVCERFLEPSAILEWIVVIGPTVFALVVEVIDENVRRHPRWRFGVIAFGLILSVLTYWQQESARRAYAKEREQAIKETSQQVAAQTSREVARTITDQYAQMLADQKTQIDALEVQLSSSLASQIQTSSTALTQALVKVNPGVLTHAKLEFSLFVKGEDRFPITDAYFPRQDDGSVDVQFLVRNISEDTSTGKGDLWILICRGCSYSKEPLGFVKREGSDDHIRHTIFQFLNPGISLEPMLLAVKPPSGTDQFQVSFKYSCEMCGGVRDWQTVTVRTRKIQDLPLKRIKP